MLVYTQAIRFPYYDNDDDNHDDDTLMTIMTVPDLIYNRIMNLSVLRKIYAVIIIW